MKFSSSLHCCLFLLFFCYQQSLIAQGSITVKGGYLSSSSNYSTMDSFFNVYDGQTILLNSQTKGTPYWNDDFTLGSIYENGVLLTNTILLRYNAYHDEMEAKINNAEDQEKIINVKKTPSFQFKIGSAYFKPIPTVDNGLQYSQVLYNGDNADLYKVIRVNYTPKIRATSSLTRDVPAIFKQDITYFLVTDSFLEIPSSKNRAVSIFKGYEQEIDACIKKYKLNLKDEKSLLRLVRYYNALL